MTDEPTIDDILLRLLDAVERHSRRTIPVSIDLWDAELIAAYLKRHKNYVLTSIVCRPDFPRAIRIKASNGNSGWPLWKATEVIAWAEGQRDRLPGRPRKTR